MRFRYTLLYVEDVERTLAFYEAAFGLKRKFLNIEGELAYGELDTGATTLGFVSLPLVQSNRVEVNPSDPMGLAPPFDIGFVTDDVDGAYTAAVAAGAAEVTAPEDKPWGERVAYLRDINGFLVALGSGVAPAE